MNVLDVAKQNQQMAWKIIDDARIIPAWESIGAEVHLVGSLRTGLLMKHRDVDFHIYTASVNLSDDFRVMTKLAENPSIKKIEYTNLLSTDEACVEWHAWYQDANGELWQIDMIHILKDSRYDGYFERVADRISAVLTDETRQAILTLKQGTPETSETEKVIGVEYYQAVLRDGVRTYAEFEAWRKQHPVTGVVEWMP